jgi:hypothetical protein
MPLVKHLTEVGEGKQINYYLFLECTGNNRHTAMAIHLYLRFTELEHRSLCWWFLNAFCSALICLLVWIDCTNSTNNPPNHRLQSWYILLFFLCSWVHCRCMWSTDESKHKSSVGIMCKNPLENQYLGRQDTTRRKEICRTTNSPRLRRTVPNYPRHNRDTVEFNR